MVLPRFQRRRGTAKSGSEWQRRPLLSAALRAVVVAGPAAGSLGLAIVLSRVLPRASTMLGALMWIGVMAASSLFLLIVLERAARKLLPLAALLNVSLLFPDKAPARFAVARRTGSPRDLRARLEAARNSGDTDGSAAAMQEVMELALALSVHDKATRGHSERVRVFSDLIADELKIDAAGRARLRWAALLHDVGKLEVPASILNKPGKPDAAEWEVIHRHPDEGARIAQGVVGWLGEWGAAVAQHHERWDGTGYPRGLRGHEISLAARIVAVADTYEVMTAPRAYKRAMSVSAARRELVRVSGTQLDPMVVRAFLNVSVGRLWRTVGFGAWVAQLPILPRLLMSLGQLAPMTASGATTVAGAALVTVGALAPGGPFAHTGGTAYATSTTPAAVATAGPHRHATADSSGSGTPTSARSGTPRPSSAPSSTATSRPVKPDPTPTQLPTATPTPTPTATPTPTQAHPWQCDGCLQNAPKTCTSYCQSSGPLPVCKTYCEGQNLGHCTSHCFSTGGDNPKCNTYCKTATKNPTCVNNCIGASNPKCQFSCAGPSNPKCTSNCHPSPAAALGAVTPVGLPLWRPLRRPLRPLRRRSAATIAPRDVSGDRH